MAVGSVGVGEPAGVAQCRAVVGGGEYSDARNRGQHLRWSLRQDLGESLLTGRLFGQQRFEVGDIAGE